MRPSHRIYCAVAILILCGCSSTPPAARPNVVDTQLAAALDRIDNALIGANNSQTKEKPEVPADHSGSGEQKNVMTVHWSGPAIGLLEGVVLKLNHDNPNHPVELVTKGQPELPLPVSVDVHDKPIDDILALIAAQISSRADITLEDEAIVLEYRVKVSKK